MSTERLQRIHQAMERHIEAGEISGAVTLVARHGKIVHFQAHGLMDLESKKVVIYLTQVGTTCSMAIYGGIPAEPERV